MNKTSLLWAAAAIAATLVLLLAWVAVQRSRREAERRQKAEQAALMLAQEQAAQAAAGRLAARQAAEEAEARLRAELAQRRQHEQRMAAEAQQAAAAAERLAEAETRAALEAAYREGQRLAAQAQQDAQNLAPQALAPRASQETPAAVPVADAPAPAPAPVPAPAPAHTPSVSAVPAAAPAILASTPDVSAPAPAPAELPAPASALGHAAPAATAAPPLVMVADDSKVVRVKTSRLLMQHGYRVVLAEDGQQAAMLLETEVPMALITDVEMPAMDGFELTRYVRLHPLAHHIPVFMITSADARLQAQASAAGVTGVLGKPYDEQVLLALVAQAAAGRRNGSQPGPPLA